MKLSDFGKKMSAANRVQELLDEGIEADKAGKVVAMFGAGNPAIIPEVIDLYSQKLRHLLVDKKTAAGILGVYESPRGNAVFIRTFADFLNRHYQLGVSEENIAVTTGSQTGYFILFNILSGRSGGKHKKILLPGTPEYIGYFDQAVDTDVFTSTRPTLLKSGDHEFEYRINFDSLTINEDIAAVCLSRPANPTGNVASDGHIRALHDLAARHDIPLMIDNAYGLPFPNIMNAQTKLAWDNHTILSFTLSKIGLPNLRTGIFVGPADLMRVVSQANGIITDAAPGIGQHLVRTLLEDDSIIHLCQGIIRPYYFQRAAKARQLIDQHFPAHLPWRLHAHHGGYFYWLWLEGAKLTGSELHDYLKARGVIVVPGEHFAIGRNDDNWGHAHECLRINFARPDQELEAGIPILAEAVAKAYGS